MNDFAGKLENFWNVFMNAGGYREVLKGLQNTLTIAVLGLLIGIVIGTVIAAVRVLPKYKRLPRVLNSICGFYVGLFRGTPMVVQLLVFYYVLLPLLGVTRLPSVTVATLVFGLNSGAYISEIMRSGILSVDSGQMEGGRSVGLSYGVTMLRIVIPQAVKAVLPTYTNEFVVLIKETAVASYIALMDLTKASDMIRNATFNAWVPLLSAAVIYLCLTLGLSSLFARLERRLARSDRG